MKLKEKVAIITGGGTGIGRATASAFAKEGAKVVISGRKVEPLEETADMIRSKGGDVRYISIDVSKSFEVKNLVNETINIYGKIDILYNNAAIYEGNGKSILDLSEEEWDKMISVNLKGTFLCTKYTLPHMIKNGGGVIINCSSIAGHVALRNQCAYNTSKGGVELFTKSMALDLSQYNIRVNAVCPGWIEIDKNREDITNRKDEILKMHPIGRIGQPEDVANAVLFLASDDSSWMTGTSLMIDGGYTSQ
jgi:NAD(P)-dependent dehydrogenase (short-subunit alcohol dehydrogenase family)